jgi:transcription elongation factor Elf1
MPTDTRDAVTERLLAPAHECVACRSVEVDVVITLEETVATARCTACGREGPLVPLGRGC